MVEIDIRTVYNILDKKRGGVSAMRKAMKTALVLLLCAGILSGCGQTYKTEYSTVFIRKDGTVISTDVEDFDVNTYDEDGLKRYVENAIAAYNQSGDDLVHLENLTVADGKATLVLAYASAAHYAAFNGVELYTGLVSKALSDGYSFDAEFADVRNGSPVACRVSDFIGSSYQVAIIRGTNINVSVPGTIVYLSAQNTSFEDKSTVAIREGTHLLGRAADDTEPETESTGPEDTEDSQEDEEDMPEIDEDILSVEENTEVIFDFGSDEPQPEKEHHSLDGAEDTGYTYIIYKTK